MALEGPEHLSGLGPTTTPRRGAPSRRGPTPARRRREASPSHVVYIPGRAGVRAVLTTECKLAAPSHLARHPESTDYAGVIGGEQAVNLGAADDRRGN
jgi:hypothetical protein